LVLLTPASPAVPAGPIRALVAGGPERGGILRDILVRQIPVVLREGLYAIPALIGAAIVVGAARAGAHGPAAPIIGPRARRITVTDRART
jgi:uncharacterized membrane protein YeiH